jgi:hypothetical protein
MSGTSDSHSNDITNDNHYHIKPVLASKQALPPLKEQRREVAAAGRIPTLKLTQR